MITIGERTYRNVAQKEIFELVKKEGSKVYVLKDGILEKCYIDGIKNMFHNFLVGVKHEYTNNSMIFWHFIDEVYVEDFDTECLGEFFDMFIEKHREVTIKVPNKEDYKAFLVGFATSVSGESGCLHFVVREQNEKHRIVHGGHVFVKKQS